jgi:hypothetical protein
MLPLGRQRGGSVARPAVPAAARRARVRASETVAVRVQGADLTGLRNLFGREVGARVRERRGRGEGACLRGGRRGRPVKRAERRAAPRAHNERRDERKPKDSPFSPHGNGSLALARAGVRAAGRSPAAVRLQVAAKPDLPQRARCAWPPAVLAGSLGAPALTRAYSFAAARPSAARPTSGLSSTRPHEDHVRVQSVRLVATALTFVVSSSAFGVMSAGQGCSSGGRHTTRDGGPLPCALATSPVDCPNGCTTFFVGLCAGQSLCCPSLNKDDAGLDHQCSEFGCDPATSLCSGSDLLPPCDGVCSASPCWAPSSGCPVRCCDIRDLPIPGGYDAAPPSCPLVCVPSSLFMGCPGDAGRE